MVQASEYSVDGAWLGQGENLLPQTMLFVPSSIPLIKDLVQEGSKTILLLDVFLRKHPKIHVRNLIWIESDVALTSKCGIREGYFSILFLYLNNKFSQKIKKNGICWQVTKINVKFILKWRRFHLTGTDFQTMLLDLLLCRQFRTLAYLVDCTRT